MADDKLVKRTIRHNLFQYGLPGGGSAIAMRGDTVDLLPADVERGEKYDAFTDRVGKKPEPEHGVLPPFPRDEDETDEQDAWVKAGRIDEILKAVNADPSIAEAVIAAETRRGEGARKTLLEALAEVATRP